MDTTRAIAEFRGNWFLRDEAKPDLTLAEQELIGAAIGPAPDRWDGRPDVARMQETVAGRSVGAGTDRPITVDGGDRQARLRAGRGVPAGPRRAARDRSYGVQRPARGGVGRGGRYAAGGVRVGSGRRDRRLDSPAHRLAGQPAADVLGRLGRVSRSRPAAAQARSRRASRAADQGQRRAGAPPRCRRRSRPAIGTRRRTRAKAPSASCAATPGRAS